MTLNPAYTRQRLFAYVVSGVFTNAHVSTVSERRLPTYGVFASLIGKSVKYMSRRC